MTFYIRLTATANVSALVTVEADSIASAEIMALKYAKDGGASWRYNGLTDDASIEVSA